MATGRRENMRMEETVDQQPMMSDEDISTLSNTFKIGGILGVLRHLRGIIDTQDKTPLDIAVTGESGAGKSSFINAVRGLTAEDDGAAEVGETKTTETPRDYPHPVFSKVKFWDLPGIGTTRFPPDDYLKKMHFEKYDFFVLIFSVRFTFNDASLVREIKKIGKTFCVIRSKIGADVANRRRSHPTSFNEEALLKTVKIDINEQLRKEGLSDVAFFLVDGYEPHKYEFSDFNLYLGNKLSDLKNRSNMADKDLKEAKNRKKEAFFKFSSHLSKGLLDEKEKILRDRIPKMVMMSAVGGTFHVVSIVVDASLLWREIEYYKKQFGLDDIALQMLATLVEKDVTTLKLQIWSKIGTCVGVKALLKIFATKMGPALVAANVARCIPFLGTLGSGGLSYQMTSSFLNEALTDMRQDADRVQCKAMEEMQ